MARLRGVAVEPAVLESTQLMLAHGLDLYYSRLTPSKCAGVVCLWELGRLTGKQGCADSLVHSTLVSLAAVTCATWDCCDLLLCGLRCDRPVVLCWLPPTQEL